MPLKVLLTLRANGLMDQRGARPALGRDLLGLLWRDVVELRSGVE